MAKTSVQKNQLRLKLNLLHPNEIPPSLPTRFLRWIVSYGRYIVIFTEIIVVAAFVYRFKLDYDLDILKNDINKNIPLIEGLISSEALINQTQLKLQTIGTTYNSSPNWKNILDNFASTLPESIRINNINIEIADNTSEYLGLKINGTTPSNNDLGVFINKLKALKDAQGNLIFKDIVLESLNYDQESLLFSISGGVKRS